VTRFYADVNLDGRITTALREAGFDVLLAQDDARDEAPDAAVLERANALERVLLTHDRDFYHVSAVVLQLGGSFVGIGHIRHGIPIGTLIEHTLLAASLYSPSEWRDQIHHLPL
jgi:predicted nuclease of predicted toxin-antitoxin system